MMRISIQEKLAMLGAIAGDIIGSVYEASPIKTKDFPLFHPQSRFTDDSVLSIAVAQAILADGGYSHWIRTIGRHYPYAGYGGSFMGWLQSENPQPYNSWGNGSAMRVSPVGWAFNDEESVLSEARKSARMTHNHPEGIKGAEATALALYLARTTGDKRQIKAAIAERFAYDLDRSVDGMREGYSFDVSCQGTVPEAIICYLESADWEDAVRNAVSLGGDSDTLACIAGAIAEAGYGSLPDEIADEALERLPEELREIYTEFSNKYCSS